MPEERTPRQVLKAFYKAEKSYMQTKASGKEASFENIAATLDPSVILHQSPDLAFGREYVGHEQHEQWAIAMTSIFDNSSGRAAVVSKWQRGGCSLSLRDAFPKKNGSSLDYLWRRS